MTQKENTIGDQNIPISTDIIYGGLLPILVKDSMRLHSSSPFSQIIPGPPHRYLPMVASIFLETLYCLDFQQLETHLLRHDFNESEIDCMHRRQVHFFLLLVKIIQLH